VGPLDDEEVADLRAEVAGLFCDTYAVLRPTCASDGQGGRVVTVVTASTGACRLDQDQSGGVEQVVADRLDTIAPATVVLPWDADVTAADRLLVNGARTFEVAAVATDGAQALSRIAICKEIPA
jgi:hypothetical protein